MIASSFTTDLFLALIVLASTILAVILVYLALRFVHRRKKKACAQQDFEPGLLDVESGRESRLSHRLSRQQIQQEQREDLLQHYSSVPRPPSIELLPEIKTSSSDSRAVEWLEQGVAHEGVDVVDGDLGEKKPDIRHVAVAKPKKQLRWECRAENMVHHDTSPGVIEKTENDGVKCVEHGTEKPNGISP
ncbi:hypothetical protein ACJQWK_05641 [Exserohilum turcicum]|uniref:Uncharacterized protein n=1 Tax=Exserohilum turcicum (strain 28A) TaxID=671987 RepID=R0KIC0_EXST2|nr:uncharacterized protein SETTUDRAFT_38281 [Exserohilum turcica Et28A]EOA88969.1 hypothetical protein SETTUDRAFT_38281 [Exserohilum turcica Et28A]